MADALTRELAAIRRRAETHATVPSADALRLVKAVETVLRQAEWAGDTAPLSVLPVQANGVHAHEHRDWARCDCPGAIPLMWALDPAKVRDGIERELTRAAAAAGEGEGS